MPAEMPIPKNVTFVTFDVYGTLIDWETGIYEAFAQEAERDGVEIDRGVLIPLFNEISREIEGGSYELYAEVLRDLVVTAQQVRSYKPEPAHFTECARRIGGKRGWVHVASSYYHDVVPCVKQRVPVIWANRARQSLEPNQKKATAEVHNLREAAKLLGA